MNEKLLQVQQATEMIRSINGLNVLRSNVNTVLPNLNDNNLQHNLQQGDTLGRYLATINQYLAKQNQPSIYNQHHQMQQTNLDNLIVQQHHLRQQLSSGQNNSNGNSPLSTQSLTDHDCNYINVINNLPQQLFCLQQQQRQYVVQQQLKNNIAKDEREMTIEEKQEALSKTFISSSEQNKFSNYDPKNCINNAQQLQILHHQQLSEKFSNSPLDQTSKMTENCKDFKHAEMNKKIEMNKANLETKFKNQNFQVNNTSPKSSTNNKRLPISSESTSSLTKIKEPDQSNNSPTKENKIASVIGVDEQGKPFHNYIGLIAQAILKSKERRLVLSQIYDYILGNYPYYNTRNSGWRNSIRHNLSLNDCFVKGPRAANGKGHYWYIHPANVRDFEKGDFRRRRAQRKVRRHLGLGMLETRLNDEDQDSEDEEIKKQFFSHFNNLQQLNQQLSLQHNLHNLESNLYHLNSTSNLLANSNSTACPQINSVETINTIPNEDYLNYFAFLRKNYLNGLNSTNTIINNQNSTENENISFNYSNGLEKNQVLEKKKDFPIKTESNDKPIDEDDFVMVDVETDSSLNKTICSERENNLENDRVLNNEIKQINEGLNNVNNDNVKNIQFCDVNLKKSLIDSHNVLERQSNSKLNDNFINSQSDETNKHKVSEGLEENNLQKNIKNNTQNELLANLGFLKKMMNDCNFIGENTVIKSTVNSNLKKQKFDMDSLLEKKEEKNLETSSMDIE